MKWYESPIKIVKLLFKSSGDELSSLRSGAPIQFELTLPFTWHLS